MKISTITSFLLLLTLLFGVIIYTAHAENEKQKSVATDDIPPYEITSP